MPHPPSIRRPGIGTRRSPPHARPSRWSPWPEPRNHRLSLKLNQPLPAGILAFDAEQKEFRPKPGKTTAPLSSTSPMFLPVKSAIVRIQTSCGCTIARTQLPMVLAPDDTAEIPINMNLAGATGQKIKTVTVHSDKGQKSLTVITTIEALPPDTAAAEMNRQRNQQLAMRRPAVGLQRRLRHLSCPARHRQNGQGTIHDRLRHLP